MENNFKYIVYQTINIENNKIYIGFHRTKDPNIFDGYIGNGININWPSTYMNPKYPFQYAVKKYGTSKFKRSVLYIFDTEKEASDKEREIVNIDFIRRKDTYNVALGGVDRKWSITYNKIYQFDLDGNLLKEWNDIYEVSEFLETWKQSIYSAIRYKQRLYNYYWSFSRSIDITTFSNPNNSRKIYQYSKEGKCIAIYNSLGEAAKENNTTSAHILMCVQNGMFNQGQYYFSYELYDKYIPKPRLDLKNKNIFLYDLLGNFVEEVSSKDFKKRYGIHTYKELSDVILNEKSLKGYQIRLEKFDKISEYKPKNKKRAVIVYTKTGEFVKEFDSVTSACKEFGLDSSTVSKILRGCGKSTKGYTIKYKN